jgi:hypothetical protein
MGHYAKVIDNKVVQVIVAEADFFETFTDTSPGEWIQTSCNTRGGIHYNPNSWEQSTDQNNALRKNFAGIGYTYDHGRDAFIPPQPFPSWILNEDTCLWDPPVPYPNDGQSHLWNEDGRIWEQVSEEE